MRLRERAAEHREVLGEREHRAAVHRAPAGHDAVARGLRRLVHAEIGRAVLDEHVELLERVLVHQQFDALARGQLAALVLRIDARLPAAEPRIGAPHFQLFQDVFHASVPSREPATHIVIGGETGQSSTNLILRRPRSGRLEGWPECGCDRRGSPWRLPVWPAPSRACRACCCASKARRSRLRAVYLFHRIGGNWWWFALILVPDISFARLPLRHAAGRHRLQRNAHHAGAARARRARLPAAVVRSHRDRAGLGRAYRHRPRARPRAEIRRRASAFTHLGRIGGARTWPGSCRSRTRPGALLRISVRKCGRSPAG